MKIVNSSRRTAPKPARRIQLIEATIDVLAQKGFSNLTISDVARCAGLSHGIVNFHFTSKDELLRETIMEMEARYCALVERALHQAKGDPSASILAMAQVEFCNQLSTERIIRAWAAFRSEAPQLYQSVCTNNDRRHFNLLVQHCRKMGGRDALLKASIIDATLKGLVQRKLLGSLPQTKARRIATACLRSVFPGHFTPKRSAASAMGNRVSAARKGQRVIDQKTDRPDRKAKRQ